MTEDAADGNKPTAIVVMGVAGSGKTVIGEALAERLGLPMLEGDPSIRKPMSARCRRASR